MGIRALTPLAFSALEAAQAGQVMVEVSGAASLPVGHAGGTSGAGNQEYIELLAGKECGAYTAADNTTGTWYFPEINFFHSIFSIGRDTGGAYVDSLIQAKTEKHDNLSRDGNWDPSTPSPSDYLLLTVSDTIFGKFTRVAVSRPHVTAQDRIRVIVTKGVV